MNEANSLPEMQELSEQIGEFVYYWGFKRIHGRIWTHLFLAQKPLDAADLVRLMSISKALVSISLRELMEYEVIHFAGKSARGTQLYRVNPDILSVIMSVLRQREKRMISHVQAAQETLARVSDADRARGGLSTENIHHLGDLVQKASAALDGFISLRPVDFSDWQAIFTLRDGKATTPEAPMAQTSQDSARVENAKADPSEDTRQAAPFSKPLTMDASGTELLPATRHLF